MLLISPTVEVRILHHDLALDRHDDLEGGGGRGVPLLALVASVPSAQQGQADLSHDS